MNNQKKSLIMLISAIVAFLLFVTFFVIGITYSGGAFAKTVLIIISVLVLLLALELFYLSLLSKDTEPNYFLFNANTNCNISVSKLTFQTINVRMNRYLAGYAASEGKLWTDKVLDNPAIEMDEAFKPLVAYKLLFDLAERDAEAAWRCFELASNKTVDFIAIGLEKNGDAEFAKALRKIKSITPVDIAHLRDMLLKNKRYLQGKMLKYVTQNINKF